MSGDKNDRVCAGHGYFERKIDDLSTAVKDGFKELNEKLDTLRLHSAALESSVKSARHDINDHERKLENLPDRISDAISQHAKGCAIGDITEVGIKTKGPRRSDTPPKGVKRPYNMDKLPRWAIGIGVGVVIAAALIGLFIGVFAVTGSTKTASDTVRKVVGQDTTESNDTGKDPLETVSAVLTGG